MPVKTCTDWEDEMNGVPCYTPCPPFYDMCGRVDHPADGFDCDQCLAKHDLKDYIE